MNRAEASRDGMNSQISPRQPATSDRRPAMLSFYPATYRDNNQTTSKNYTNETTSSKSTPNQKSNQPGLYIHTPTADRRTVTPRYLAAGHTRSYPDPVGHHGGEAQVQRQNHVGGDHKQINPAKTRGIYIKRKDRHVNNTGVSRFQSQQAPNRASLESKANVGSDANNRQSKIVPNRVFSLADLRLSVYPPKPIHKGSRGDGYYGRDFGTKHDGGDSRSESGHQEADRNAKTHTAPHGHVKRHGNEKETRTHDGFNETEAQDNSAMQKRLTQEGNGDTVRNRFHPLASYVGVLRPVDMGVLYKHNWESINEMYYRPAPSSKRGGESNKVER